MAAQVYWQSEELLAACITPSTCRNPTTPPELPSCYGPVKGFSLRDLINSPVGGQELMTHCREQWGETVTLGPWSSGGKLDHSQSAWQGRLGSCSFLTQSHVDGKLGKVSTGLNIDKKNMVLYSYSGKSLQVPTSQKNLKWPYLHCFICWNIQCSC